LILSGAVSSAPQAEDLAMSYKTILAVIQSVKDVDRVLDCALPLAERNGGHVVGVHAEPMPVAYATTVGFADTTFIETQVQANRQRATALEQRFASRIGSTGLAKDWRSMENYSGDSALCALNCARSVDLIVAAQIDPQDDAASSAELDTLLYNAGRPMLFVPHDGPVLTSFAKITVAWNGTREAARAAFDALPFILAADSTEILLVDPPDPSEAHHESDGSDLAAALDRHGANVTVAEEKSRGLPIGSVIENHVVEAGADLLVMGAYSHSRLREWLFGGVTRSVLKSMPVATFMSR
jgi:nucleotide-binding universal stress UspA family protein